MRGQASVRMRGVVGISVAKLGQPWVSLGGAVSYGPSVQVKTCENPHDRTSASDSCWDLIGIVQVWGQLEVVGGGGVLREVEEL